jgi:hypothetical protein
LIASVTRSTGGYSRPAKSLASDVSSVWEYFVDVGEGTETVRASGRGNTRGAAATELTAMAAMLVFNAVRTEPFISAPRESTVVA